MTDKTYNGWNNYETWLAKLWLDNEQGSYYDVTGHATEMFVQAREDETEPDKYVFADWLEEYVRENLLPEDVNGLASALLNAAVSEIDWFEMAESYLADARENAEYEASH